MLTCSCVCLFRKNVFRKVKMVETEEKEKKIGGKLNFLDVFGWDKNFTGNLKRISCVWIA